MFYSKFPFIPKYLFLNMYIFAGKNHWNELFAFVTEIRCPPRGSSRIDAASLDLRRHYSWIRTRGFTRFSRECYAYTCRSRIQRRSRCIVLWLSSRRKRVRRRSVRDRRSSIDRKINTSSETFYIHVKENGNARCLEDIYIYIYRQVCDIFSKCKTSDINFDLDIDIINFRVSRILKIRVLKLIIFIKRVELFFNNSGGKIFVRVLVDEINSRMLKVRD